MRIPLAATGEATTLTRVSLCRIFTFKSTEAGHLPNLAISGTATELGGSGAPVCISCTDDTIVRPCSLCRNVSLLTR